VPKHASVHKQRRTASVPITYKQYVYVRSRAAPYCSRSHRLVAIVFKRVGRAPAHLLCARLGGHERITIIGTQRRRKPR